MLEDVAFMQIMPNVFTNRTVTYVYVASLLYDFAGVTIDA
jgi:hypothetical protein